MIDEELKERLKKRIQRSRFKELADQELRPLLAEKPADVAGDEFCSAVLQLVSEELNDHLDHPDRLDQSLAEPKPGAADNHSPGDFEQAYAGILREVSFRFTGSSLQMLRALGSAVAVRDTGNSDHSYRVTIYAVRFAEKLGMDASQIRALIKGSFLHDVGKISIPDSTLLKQGKLTEREFLAMRNHVLMGAHVIKDVRWLEDATDVVLHHHERYDGSGYLSGLKGEEIPYIARVFCIVDVFDALTSERPYKKAIPTTQAAEMLRTEAGSHFDPAMVEPFIEISNNIYTEAGSADTTTLEKIIASMMSTYFGVDPTDKDLRSKNA